MNDHKKYQSIWDKGTDPGVVGPDAYTVSEKGTLTLLNNKRVQNCAYKLM